MKYGSTRANSAAAVFGSFSASHSMKPWQPQAGGGPLAIDHLNEANRLNAGHDRLAQIAAEPVLTTLRPATITWVPLRKGVMTITH
jgi:hypothetical protein